MINKLPDILFIGNLFFGTCDILSTTISTQIKIIALKKKKLSLISAISLYKDRPWIIVSGVKNLKILM